MKNRKTHIARPERAIRQIRLWRFLFLLVLLPMVMAPSAGAQNRTLTAYFEGTDHELQVYRIYGKEAGKTLLLIGGIQGDEPGGFLSADHYADFSLAKGNLIVVPRANFQSIVLQRRKINEDMNRKFAEDQEENYEAKIVRILKKLIQESDCLLNLHDGSGFYDEKWVNEDRNPYRFGQSIIADGESVVHPAGESSLNLGEIARFVCERMNLKIQDPNHHFHFNNHRTQEEDSPHKEQRKSATYYALYSVGIPAFGIESSKELPLEQKVRHHNLAINAFMEWLGIVPENPGLNLDPPELRYVVISVNDSLPVAVQDGQVLKVRSGDTLRVSHIEANYERGLSADILGAGTINDFRRKIKILQDTKIVVRKDYIPCGSIAIQTGASAPVPVSGSESALKETPMLLFQVRINGRDQIYPNNGRAVLIRGDRLEIVDVITSHENPQLLTVNFKGYVGDPRKNTGEDRGYVIDTAADLWERYSIEKEGKTYRIVASDAERVLGTLLVELREPEVKYVVVQQADGPMVCLAPGALARVDFAEPFRLIDVRTNLPADSMVQAYLSRGEGLREPLPMGSAVALQEGVPSPDRIDLYHNAFRIGSIPLAPVRSDHAGQRPEPSKAQHLTAPGTAALGKNL